MKLLTDTVKSDILIRSVGGGKPYEGIKKDGSTR